MHSIILRSVRMSAVMEQTANGGSAPPEAPQQPQVPEGHAAFSFHFRTEKIRDEAGNTIGTGKKHPEVVAVLPVPSDAEIIDFIANGGKEKDYLREVISDAIKNAARAQINDYREANPDATVTPDILDLSKLTFSAIANMDKRDRAPEIPEEVWNTFYEDYKQVLVALGTPPDRVNKHIILFKSQLRTARYDKPALGVLKDRLNMYAAKTDNMEDNKDCFEFLMNKIDKYLKAEERNLVNAL